ncbi:OmpH family outer membrane protein [Fulvivirgaceae bacterium PWU4]|uniref:OmpH family outer membrane protein n=1 Tax=Chryseosolibacter histidini TaxID=2782349 RepID=A0AAP2DPC1_9BACT|nr:OmpH family outer membrane protein [Chryseosolibacter histidini]MBT1700040.1 OmpH family outer membrane protein [Chryseosolibacter histidini]
MRKLVSLLVLTLGFFASQAQTTTASVKIGYADVDYIFSQMPEAKQIDSDLKATQTMLKNQIEGKAQEFQKKLQDYNANLNTMLDAVRQNTERELQQMQQNLEKLQQDAQTTIQNKQTQLMEPVYKKVGKAIEDVAKENGFTFVLNQQIGGLDVILYGDEKMDVSDLVLKKMGVTPAPKPEAKAGTPPKQ